MRSWRRSTKQVTRLGTVWGEGTLLRGPAARPSKVRCQCAAPARTRMAMTVMAGGRWKLRAADCGLRSAAGGKGSSSVQPQRQSCDRQGQATGEQPLVTDAWCVDRGCHWHLAPVGSIQSAGERVAAPKTQVTRPALSLRAGRCWSRKCKRGGKSPLHSRLPIQR